MGDSNTWNTWQSICLPTNGHAIHTLRELNGWLIAEAGDDVFIVDIEGQKFTKTTHAFLSSAKSGEN